MSADQQLPDDLIECGYKLIVRAPDRMFAVSRSWGCTKTYATLPEVVHCARKLIRYIEFMNEKRAKSAAHIGT